MSDPARQIVHGTYYPHIDGIRAFAVLPVVLFHLLARLCPGGFVGVDVFYVISGYLITGSVLRDLAKGQFTLGGFYHRRIRRIMPAYCALIAGVLLIGSAVYYALPLMYLGDTAIVGTLFSANIFFYIFGGNYFAPDIHNNALLHLWSLSVEEQFYLVIPLLCALVWKVRPRLVGPTLWLIALASLAGSIYAVAAGKPESAFYLLHFRAWELLAGALLSLLPPLAPADAAARPLWRRPALLAARGLLLVVIPTAVMTSKTPFPGATALPLVLGTALLIRFGQFGWVTRVLSWRPFVFVGQISYSLYLWHWPVIVFWRYMTYEQLTAWDYVGMLALSLVLSILSWRFVELPVRLAKTWTPRHSFTFATAGIALLVAVSLGCVATRGWPTRLHPAANAVSGIEEFPSRIMRLFVFVDKRVAALSGRTVRDPFQLQFGIPGDYTLGAPGRPPDLVLLGDSHAGMLQFGLDARLRDAGRAGLAINRSSTKMFNLRRPEGAQALAALGRHPEATRVLLVQNWNAYLKKPAQRAAVYAALAQFAARVRAQGQTLYIVAAVPERAQSPSDIAARTRIIPPRRLEPGWADGRQDAAVYARTTGAINRRLQDICRQTGAIFVPMQQAFREGDAYIAFAQDGARTIPLYRDTDHLTRAGSLRAARFLLDYMARGTAPAGEKPVP